MNWSRNTRVQNGDLTPGPVITNVCCLSEMENEDRLFTDGIPNPDRFGFWSLRSSSGSPPNSERIDEIATALGRERFFVDGDAYEREIIGACKNPTGDIAYVESRNGDGGHDELGFAQRYIDVSIKIHLQRKNGKTESVDIESYNPFFGCDVRFFEFVDPTFVLIYDEKHWTFACKFGDIWPPKFVKIEDRWIINNGVIAYIGYNQPNVRRVTFPNLDELPVIPIQEAESRGELPPK